MGKLLRDFLSEAEGDANEAITAALWLQMATIVMHTGRSHGGSLPGKAGNKQRDYAASHRHYMKKYFGLLQWFDPELHNRDQSRMKLPSTECFACHEQSSIAFLPHVQ